MLITSTVFLVDVIARLLHEAYSHLPMRPHCFSWFLDITPSHPSLPSPLSPVAWFPVAYCYFSDQNQSPLSVLLPRVSLPFAAEVLRRVT